MIGPVAERRLRDWFGMRYKNADMAARVSVWGSRAECIDKLGEIFAPALGICC